MRFVGAEAFEFVISDELGKLVFGIFRHLALLHLDGLAHDFAFRLTSLILADGHRQRPGDQRDETAYEHRDAAARGHSNAGHHAHRRENAVFGSEDEFAHAPLFLQLTALRRVGNARLDAVPARRIYDDFEIGVNLAHRCFSHHSSM